MRTIDAVIVTGKRILVRADLNVPPDGTRITDDGRIRACLPTLNALSARGAEQPIMPVTVGAAVRVPR